MPPSNRRHHDAVAEEAHTQPLADQEAPAADGLTEKQSAVVGLSQTIGNRAVARLLQGSGGSPLPGPARQQGEARLGRPVSDDVRVHTGPEAAASADALQAAAYTVGPDIVFGESAYAPGTEAGDKLLTHELAHVAQQEQTGVAADPTRLNPRGHASEQQAQAASRGQPTALNAAPAGIARAEPDAGFLGQWEEVTPLTPAEIAEARKQMGLDQPKAEVDLAAAAEADAQQLEIQQNLVIADTRARNYLNQLNDEVQDACAIFANRAAGQIDSLKDDLSPSAYQGLLPTLFDTTLGFLGDRFPGGDVAMFVKLGQVASPYATMANTYITEAAKERAKLPNDEAKSLVTSYVTSAAEMQSAAFALARQRLKPQLTQYAGQKGAQILLASGSLEDIDKIVTQDAYLGIPNPEESPLFKEVLTKLATQFDLWLAKEKRDQEHPHLGSFDMDARTIRATEESAADWAAGIAQQREVGELTIPESEAPTGSYSGFDTEVVKGGGSPDVNPEVEYQNMAIVDTRVQAYLGAHRNAMQDAVRDFGLSAAEQIEAMPDGSLSASWTNVSPWIDTAASALTVAWPPSAVAVAVAGVIKSASETWITESSTGEADALKDDAKAAMRELATSGSNHYTRAFSEAQQAAFATLNYLRGKDPVVKGLIQAGGPEEVETLISFYLKVPSPDSVDTYTKIRTRLEQDFAEKRITAHLQSLRPDSMQDFDVDPVRVANARAFAEEKVLADAKKRSGEREPTIFDPLLEGAAAFYDQLPVPPPEPEVEYDIDPAELDVRVAWGILKPEEVLPPKPEPEPEPEALSEAEAAQRAVQVRQNALLADTRARVFINTHYNDLQAALFDFSNSAGRKLGVLEDPSLNYISMLGPLIGVVNSKVTGLFDEDNLLAQLGGAAAAGGESVLLSKYTESLTSGNEDTVSKAAEMVEGMAQEMSNRYSGAFLKRQKSLASELGDLVAKDKTVLKLLTDGGLDNLNTIVTDYLHVPDPDEDSLYESVRVELEAELAGWIAYNTSTSRWLGVREDEAKEASAEARNEAEEAAARRRPKLED